MTEKLVYRVVICGDSSVGKTSLVSRHMFHEMPEDQAPTVGAACFHYEREYEGRDIAIDLWDTAGQERYAPMSKLYYRSAIGGIFVYDLSNEVTLNHLDNWIMLFKTSSKRDSRVFVVGNKCDLVGLNSTAVDQGMQWAEERGYQFFATSALNGTQVSDMFDAVLRTIADTNEKGILKFGLSQASQVDVGGPRCPC